LRPEAPPHPCSLSEPIWSPHIPAHPAFIFTPA
jgi:hypothetical protein